MSELGPIDDLPEPTRNGADERNRTVDLLITNELLYQLSYIGTKAKIIAEGLAAP